MLITTKVLGERHGTRRAYARKRHVGKVIVLLLYVIAIFISDGFIGLKRSFNRYFRVKK
jgi:hypothetical protein